MGVIAHRRAAHGVPLLKPVNGWAITNATHVQYDGDEKVLNVTVDQAGIESLRLGVFRIGFAHRIVARNARIDIAVPSEREIRIKHTALDIQHVLAALGGGASGQGGPVSGASIDGFRLRATAETGAWLEVTASRCETAVLNPARVRLEGDVHVRSATADLGFARLVFDARSKHFVTSDGGRIDAASDTGESESPISLANRAVADVMQLDGQPES